MASEVPDGEFHSWGGTPAPHSCQDREEQEKAFARETYNACISLLDHLFLTCHIRKQQYCYLGSFLKQIKLCLCMHFKRLFSSSFLFLLNTRECLLSSAYILKWFKNCVVKWSYGSGSVWRIHKRIPSFLNHGPQFQLMIKITLYLISSNFISTMVFRSFSLSIAPFSV